MARRRRRSKSSASINNKASYPLIAGVGLCYVGYNFNIIALLVLGIIIVVGSCVLALVLPAHKKDTGSDDGMQQSSNQQKEIPTQNPQLPPQDSSADSRWTCSYCRTRNPPENKTCSGCGSSDKLL